MRELTDKEHKEMLRNLLYISIISADNDRYTEEQKQAVMRRYNKGECKDWKYILEPVDSTGKLAELFKEAE